MTKNTASAGRDDLEQDAIAMQESLAELVRVYQFRDRQRVCYYDVSVTQCYAISFLVAGGPTTLNKLAGALYLDKSTASRTVDSLVRLGYVCKTIDSEDARALSLEVSAKGRRLHRQIEQDLVDQMKRLMADFEPEVRQESARLLARLAEAARMKFTDSTGGSC